MRFLCFLLALVVGTAVARAAPQELTFTSWGGSYAQSQVKVVVTPFAAATGVKVTVAEYGGGLEQLRRQRAAGRIEWDVVDLSLPDALTACEEGLLEKIDPSILEVGVHGERPEQDYIADGLTNCLAGTNIWSTVLVFNRKAFSGREPRSVIDLFDLATFPGKRALQKVPDGNLEWALMADGVPLESVYEVLGTPQGLERAFRKLDTIKSHVVWWESGAQPQHLIASGEVSMASAFNGRVYAAMMRSDSPIRYLWDGQLLNMAGLGIVKGTRNLGAAQAFVRYATRPSVMAALAPLTAYGPPRVSAAELIDPVTMHLLPTAPWYRKRSLAVDARWWAVHGEKLRMRFMEWVAR